VTPSDDPENIANHFLIRKNIYDHHFMTLLAAPKENDSSVRLNYFSKFKS